MRTKKLSKYLPMILTQLDEIINLTPTSTISSIIFYTSYSVLSTKYTYTGERFIFFFKKKITLLYLEYICNTEISLRFESDATQSNNLYTSVKI